MSVSRPTNTQYFGKVCDKHPEYLGLRRKCNGQCQKCAQELASKRHRANVRNKGETTYIGSLCEEHPEYLGKRRSINGRCVKCHNESVMKKELIRKKIDPLKNMRCRVANRVLFFLKRGGYSKKSKTAQMLGCDWQTLKEHLESKFTDGMSWDNRHLWHIDHIIPLSSGKTEEEVMALCHYLNLQPLWAEDNIRKGNKLPVK